MGYVDNYYALCHGTTLEAARKIIENGFEIRTPKDPWLGEGVYFYDRKRKAWWYSDNTCRYISKEEDRPVQGTVLFVDILNIPYEDIFDLRIRDDMEDFQVFVEKLDEMRKKDFPDTDSYCISSATNEDERRAEMRSYLIGYYVKESRKKLVIANIRQSEDSIKAISEETIKFSDSLGIVLGVETVYCVKDLSIMSKPRQGGVKWNHY